MQEASVYRGNATKQFVIKVKETPRNVEFITTAKDVCIASLRKEDFANSFTLSNQNPAHAARTWLSGTKRIEDRARALLDIISQTEYIMPPEAQAAVATPAAKPPKAPKAPKVATGEAKVPKTPKEPKAPKLDADGNPIVAKKKVYPKAVFTDESKIATVASPNPKRGASAERFAKYKVGMTVAEAIAAGIPRADLNWDIPRGLITIA